MTTDLFDQQLLAARRSRSLRQGPDLFLHERAFEDILERLSLVRRSFRSALLIGWNEAGWADRLRGRADLVHIVAPDALSQLEPGTYDLAIAAGDLDTVDDLPRAFLTVRFALREDSLFVGAVSGGDTLPRLRFAMRAADDAMGAASPHVHPRIDPAGLTSLLTDAGFEMPVVDVDRVQVSYERLWDLVRDLRRMGATNVLSSRSKRPLSRAAAAIAAEQFTAGSEDGRTTETFEILHFAGWTPAAPPNG